APATASPARCPAPGMNILRLGARTTHPAPPEASPSRCRTDVGVDLAEQLLTPATAPPNSCIPRECVDALA
ncbi:hypothetical protein PUR28_00860, partial [Streptomyces sp. BE308]|uniref:hypothetical protein n=1 Tax=Streptomyces sp. BE308 TaxID=3002529 RepID=UPI002E766373